MLKHVARIENYMIEINAPTESFDSTDLKVVATLLPSLLRENGRLKFIDDIDRIPKAIYKAFIERLFINVNIMFVNRNNESITNEQSITRNRVAHSLMGAEN